MQRADGSVASAEEAEVSEQHPCPEDLVLVIDQKTSVNHSPGLHKQDGSGHEVMLPVLSTADG